MKEDDANWLFALCPPRRILPIFLRLQITCCLCLQVLKEDDANWPAPDRVGRQELEVRWWQGRGCTALLVPGWCRRLVKQGAGAGGVLVAGC